MARLNSRQGFPPERAAVSARSRVPQARPARRLRTFQVERLEDRLLMKGDDPFASTAALAQRADAVAFAADATTGSYVPDLAVDELSERFTSAAGLEAWRNEAAVEQWGYLFGQTTYYPDSYWLDCGDIAWDPGLVVPLTPVIDVVGFRGTPLNLSGTVLDTAFSNTNLQVEGVDEADLVETDGEYLYILSGKDLVIVEAGVGDDLQIVSRMHVEG